MRRSHVEVLAVAQIFPRWTNHVPTALALALPVAGLSLIFGVWYWFSPKFTDVGYAPEQPVPFSHALHAGQLGMDCRYCHNTVERAAHAAVPPSQTCMNCHATVRTDSAVLAPVRESAATDSAIPWVRVHMLPDYAYFDHSPHLAAGVGCATCHGRIDEMTIVQQAQPLSMSWCLDCHRNPTPNLRPRDQITNMGWDATTAQYDPHADPTRTRELAPPQNCSGCHR
ncbi:MAG: cytochrome C [Myxococcales bacterium]|nr:cytochrome C [Myxococcales bacterium]MCB9519332.1 cytochrome C [Myxococcales bacterium]MCB9530776.1 cytochrome C [Myxococcales bacterium]MCB9533330.1 cytochrome C [Myxococcales bacterium]